MDLLYQDCRCRKCSNPMLELSDAYVAHTRTRRERDLEEIMAEMEEQEAPPQPRELAALEEEDGEALGLRARLEERRAVCASVEALRSMHGVSAHVTDVRYSPALTHTRACLTAISEVADLWSSSGSTREDMDRRLLRRGKHLQLLRALSHWGRMRQGRRRMRGRGMRGCVVSSCSRPAFLSSSGRECRLCVCLHQSECRVFALAAEAFRKWFEFWKFAPRFRTPPPEKVDAKTSTSWQMKKAIHEHNELNHKLESIALLQVSDPMHPLPTRPQGTWHKMDACWHDIIGQAVECCC